MQVGVDLSRFIVDGDGSARRLQRMPGRVGVLEDDHQSIASRFVDITVVLMNVVQKAGKVAFDQIVDFALIQRLANLRIASNIKKQDGNVPVLFLQLWGMGIGINEFLHRLGYKFLAE